MFLALSRVVVYLETTAQKIANGEAEFVFSEGHGLAAYTEWFDDLSDLIKVDWGVVYERYWTDNANDMDRQRKKKAEFLVHAFCEWSLIEAVIVINASRKAQVEQIFAGFDESMHRPISIKRDWYYY